MNGNQLPYYFQILSDANRLRIISLVGSKELSVTEIVSEMQQSQPLVSHHLKVLKESGILETKRNGPFIYYRLKNPKFLDVLGIFEEVLPKDAKAKMNAPMFICPPCFQNFI